MFFRSPKPSAEAQAIADKYGLGEKGGRARDPGAPLAALRAKRAAAQKEAQAEIEARGELAKRLAEAMWSVVASKMRGDGPARERHPEQLELGLSPRPERAPAEDEVGVVTTEGGEVMIILDPGNTIPEGIRERESRLARTLGLRWATRTTKVGDRWVTSVGGRKGSVHHVVKEQSGRLGDAGVQAKNTIQGKDTIQGHGTIRGKRP